MKKKSQPKIKVFLVDDHPAVREGVRSYLTSQGSVVVVGEASDAQEALRKVKKLAPDVIVLDVNLPAIDGGELARRLRRLIPKTRLIAFSIHSSEAYVVKMARCGVQGYVTKDQPAGELLAAIKDAFKGGLHFPAEALGRRRLTGSTSRASSRSARSPASRSTRSRAATAL